MPTTRTVTREEDIDRIYDLRAQLDTAEMGYLSRQGWRHTSSTPDSVWVWEKVFGPVTLQVSRERALSIEGITS